MSNLRSSLVGSLCLVVSLFAGAAKADCQAFLAPHFQWLELSETAVGFTYVTMQPESTGLVTYTASNPIGPFGGVLRRNQGTSMKSSFYSDYPGARQLYSDRKVNNQPFTISNLNQVYLQVFPDGTVWFLSSTGAVVGQLSNPVCANNLMYGWGPSLSAYTSPTMYVFHFYNTSVLN